MTRLIGLIVATLALLASAQTALAAKAVGTTAAVNPQATGQAPGEPSRTLVLGSQLVFKERINTTGKGLVQVLLLDGTSLTVGPGSSVVIDEFVYDPNAGTGKLVINFNKGAMRFIGGKLSKNEAAVVKTPLGTLGIRGGIANVVVQGKEGTFSLLFGKELTLEGSDGQKQSVFQQGYTIDIKPGGSLVRKLTANDVKILKTILSGAGGGGGGASEKPTDKDVADSGLTEVNSEQTPDTSQDGQVVKATETGELQAEISNDIGTTTNTPPAPMRSYQVRSLSAPFPSYNVSFGPVIFDPGAKGLVGGTDDPTADELFTAQQTTANNLVVSNGVSSINVPFNTTPGNYPVSFLGFEGNLQIGNMFVGSNADFLFYSLFENGEIDKPTYAFGGVPTPAAGLQGGDRLLTYDLFADPQQGIAMPFTLASLVTNPELASVSPLYLMAPDGVAIGDNTNAGVTGASNVLAGSLLINGQGASQNSAVSLLVGHFFIDTGQAEYGSGDRGSIRAAADEGSLVAGGSINSIAGPEGSSFFGQDANNFVLNNDSPNNGAIGYNGVRFDEYDGENELLFGATHVANQVGSEAQSSLTRSTQTFTGYAAGMLESRNYYDPDNTNPDAIAYRSTSSEGMSLGFDASRDTMSASMEIEDVQNADGNTSHYNFGFGYSEVTGNSGRGAYIDDDRYGATGSNDPDATYVTTDDGAGEGSTVAGMDTGIGNYAYLLGSELAPQTGFFSAGNAPCTCKFLEWGYWGTEVEWAHTPVEDVPHSHVDNFHLGTWVAGDVTDDLLLLPTLGTASYSGHAVGNVARFDGYTPTQSVAGGGFGMDWDFASRNGTATISDFDGVTVSGTMTAPPSAAGPNGFSGGLYHETDEGLSGNLNGSFVTGPLGPAQGVIGSFDLTGDGFVATGIVAGEQVVP